MAFTAVLRWLSRLAISRSRFWIKKIVPAASKNTTAMINSRTVKPRWRCMEFSFFPFIVHGIVRAARTLAAREEQKVQGQEELEPGEVPNDLSFILLDRPDQV